MKRLSILVILTILLAVVANAQVLNQATVQWIEIDNSGAEPFLCVFGNTPEDVTLIDSLVGLDGKEVFSLRERVEQTNLSKIFINEMIRLNVRFLSIHTTQRRFDAEKGIVAYFIVDIIERVGNKYYLVASSNF